MTVLVDSAGTVVGTVFTIAGVTKLYFGRQLEEALHLSGKLPPHYVPVVRSILPPMELVIGLLLLTGIGEPMVGIAAAVFLIVVSAATWDASSSHGGIRCACFGFGDSRIDRGLTVRNVTLACYALIAGSLSNDNTWELARSCFQSGSRAAVVAVDLIALTFIPFVFASSFSAWQGATRLVSTHDLARGWND